MKSYLILIFTGMILLSNSCSNGQSNSGNTSLSATAFSDKINQTSAAQIIDVRTPEEYGKGHLLNALNIDWYSNDFQTQMSTLDKLKPVFVYCLSGGRSSSAAAKMRADGFKEVYELSGGIMKWRAADLPETTSSRVMSGGMSAEQFAALINSDQLVLVDFYADWCGPCKKMKPYLEEIASTMKNKVKVIRINADDNQVICKTLKIDALPVLQLYKNKSLIWSNSGYIDKDGVLKQLK